MIVTIENSLQTNLTGRNKESVLSTNDTVIRGYATFVPSSN